MDLSHMQDNNYVYKRLKQVFAEMGEEVGLATEVKVSAVRLKPRMPLVIRKKRIIRSKREKRS